MKRSHPEFRTILLNKSVLLIFILFSPFFCASQSTEEMAGLRIKQLQDLAHKAGDLGLDATREKLTLNTADIFLKYAIWDEQHVDENVTYFKKVGSFKDSASQMAAGLPNFERNEVISMLDKSISTLNDVIAGKIIRKPGFQVDWTKVTLDKDQLTYIDRPVFLHDYTWKPNNKELRKFQGQLDGFFLSPAFLVNEQGEITKKINENLLNKKNEGIGFVFFNHKNVPKWIEEKYKNIHIGERLFTQYDIDNPGAIEMQQLLLKGTIPLTAGKKFSELGYMLANEPHWNTIADTWETGTVSNYTIDKFKTWLQKKHGNIEALNALWKTGFSGFEDVTITVPIDAKLQGTPKGYDWLAFNMDRVTDWFTFLHDEVRKYDSNAKTHIKIMPQLWSDNTTDHGLDLEKLTKLTEIIGNDAQTDHIPNPKKPEDWQDKYAFGWRKTSMPYDFMKSVSPDKIIFNTESHFLSVNRVRDLYTRPEYARAVYWMAYMQGLNACQTWYWARNVDGSISDKAGVGYAGSNNQQPQIVNEVAATLMDLNAFSEEITAMQRQEKNIRIFYSKTSNINETNYMDDVFALYESLFFEGMPIGFATQDIINRQNNSDWKVVLINKTPFVTKVEFEALQAYLDKGGTVIMDVESLKKNEYGYSLEKLKAGGGKLIIADNLAEMKQKAIEIISENGLLPQLQITEKNEVGAKGCLWRVIKNKDGHNVVSIINMGKSAAKLHIEENGKLSTCKNLLTGSKVSGDFVLKPLDVFFAEIE